MLPVWMNTLTKLLQPGSWFTSTDLREAYFRLFATSLCWRLIHWCLCPTLAAPPEWRGCVGEDWQMDGGMLNQQGILVCLAVKRCRKLLNTGLGDFTLFQSTHTQQWNNNLSKTRQSPGVHFTYESEVQEVGIDKWVKHRSHCQVQTEHT